MSSSSEDLEKQSIQTVSHLTMLKELINEKFIDGFSPAFYIPVMGTGITSAITYNFAFEARWIRVCSHIFFALACIIFLMNAIFFMLHVYRKPSRFVRLIVDPKVAPFMGCLPMGYITIINYIYFLTGKNWIIGVWTLWWISVVLSVYTSFIVFHFTFIAKRGGENCSSDPKSLHPTMLLPVVALTVATSSGNLFALDLPSITQQITTIVVSYILWCIAIFLAVMVMASHFWKLFVHKVPPTGMIFTSFIPIGFLGQGAFGMLLFGSNVQTLLMTHKETILTSHYLKSPAFDSSEIDINTLSYALGQSFHLGCMLASMFLISFGYFYTFVAAASVLSKLKIFANNYNKQSLYFTNKGGLRKVFEGLIRFNFGYWAMTFPLGTMALANNEFSKSLGGMKAFQVVSAIYAVTLITIVIGCTFGFFYRCIYNIRNKLAFIE